jgi:enoyl-CoA hydratase
MSDDLLVVSQHDTVRVLTLNRPDKRNALSTALRAQIVSALSDAAADDATASVVITGAGPTFSAGFDLAEVMASPNPAALFADAAGYHRALHRYAKPLVAAVNGPALAGGFDVVLLCDIVIAAETATFGQPQVTKGIPASYELMADVLPRPLATELALTGRVIDAAEAQRAGFVHRVVPAADVLGAALQVAQAAAAGGARSKASIVGRRPEIW